MRWNQAIRRVDEMESSNKKSRLMKRVDEKNEMKNSINHDDDDDDDDDYYVSGESVDNDDDYGYAVNTTTNKRKRN